MVSFAVGLATEVVTGREISTGEDLRFVGAMRCVLLKIEPNAGAGRAGDDVVVFVGV